MKPHYEAASEKVEGNFYSVDIDFAQKSLVDRFFIQSVPTVLIFRDKAYLGEMEARNVMGIVKELEQL